MQERPLPSCWVTCLPAGASSSGGATVVLDIWGQEAGVQPPVLPEAVSFVSPHTRPCLSVVPGRLILDQSCVLLFCHL